MKGEGRCTTKENENDEQTRRCKETYCISENTVAYSLRTIVGSKSVVPNRPHSACIPKLVQMCVISMGKNLSQEIASGTLHQKGLQNLPKTLSKSLCAMTLPDFFLSQRRFSSKLIEFQFSLFF